jgi:transcriptional regulator with XRE-family HTH domain
MCVLKHNTCVKSHIHKILAAKRRLLGMSQNELALRAGLRREKVNRVESRGENIGLDELSRLADALGLELQLAEKVEEERPAATSPKLSSRGSFVDGARARIVDWGKLPD